MPGRFPSRLIDDLWRLRCSTGWAHGSIWTHPRGFELRVLKDGRPVWTGLRKDLARLQEDARAVKRRLECDGFDGLATLGTPSDPPPKAGTG